jgi:uncharacterized membrane protein
MRASGVPAPYVQGTLSQSDTQQLVLSTFPPQYQTVGYIPAGAQVSDPANDPALLAETENHYWFEFDASSGMQDADPLMAGATIGQRFATSGGTFTEVPDALREKTEVQLIAEITSQGLLGATSSDKSVLDQTFNDVSLVGHPLTFGNFVSGQSTGFLITATTYTYTPYVAIGDDANPDPNKDETTTGTPYQEVFTNFPFSSSEVTGLSLNVTLSGPQGAPQTYENTFYDGIGYDVRLHGGTPAGSGQPAGAPTLNPFQVWSLSVLSGMQDPTTPFTTTEALLATYQNLDQRANADPAGASLALTRVMIGQSRAYLDGLLADSGALGQPLAQAALVAAYFARPRLTLLSANFTSPGAPGKQIATFSLGADLVGDSPVVIAAPGQCASSIGAFRDLRGIFESQIESNVFPHPDPSTGVQVVSQDSATTVLQAAADQGIPLVALTPEDVGTVDTLMISAEAKDRITAALQAGLGVIVPRSAPTLNGTQTIAWLEVNPQTGETTGVLENGAHGGSLVLLGAILSVTAIVIVAVEYFMGKAAASAVFPTLAPDLTLAQPFANYLGVSQFPPRTSKRQVKEMVLAKVKQLVDSSVMTVEKTHFGPYVQGYKDEIYSLLGALRKKLYSKLYDPAVPQSLVATPDQVLPAELATQGLTLSVNAAAGSVAGTAPAAGLSLAGTVSASWTGGGTAGFLADSLTAGAATVRNATGAIVGTGAVALAAAGPDLVSVTVAGAVNYQATGSGDLSFYETGTTGLSVGARWDTYTATLAGTATLTLTTSALTLNGQVLPAGTYTIAASAAALSGSGPSQSPTFTGGMTVDAENARVVLAPGSGGVSVGGSVLGPASGATLKGYTGHIVVSAGSPDQATFAGSAAQLLQVVGQPGAVAADENTPATFRAAVRTSLAGSYSVLVSGPKGWNVVLDPDGNVTVTPAAGTQGGTYPVRILVESEADASLDAQATVQVTVSPTRPGFTFSVQPDADHYVSINGADLPSAFLATIHNTGPSAETFDLKFSTPPAGFSYLTGPGSMTVPAGEMGTIGIYLQPTIEIPAPGTHEFFTVTATPASGTASPQMQTVDFTVPAVDAVSLSVVPTSLATTPGATATATLTITNVGNVSEPTVTLSATTSPGFAVGGLAPASLAPGQSNTETITLTPDTSTPLGSILDATITASFGPTGAPVTQSVDIPVSVVVPGAAAIANASVAVSQLGNFDLANRLNDLSTALTNLVQSPTSDVFKSQALADVSSIVSQLEADPFLASFAGGLASAGNALSEANSASTIQAAVMQLGNALGGLNTAMGDLVKSRFTVSMTPNSAIAQSQSPEVFNIVLQNTGKQATTYDLAVSGLPASVFSQLSDSSVTLQPGQEDNTINVTLTETGRSLSAAGFTVTATPEGAPELAQTVQGTLTARADLVDVESIDATPPFASAGRSVDVAARVLNAVNQAQQAQGSFTVTNSAGTVVFTSTQVPVSLGVQAQLSTVDLGNFDTTGLANGDYSINVTLTDSSGQPIPGASGMGTLLVGTPVSASFAVSPTTLPAGGGTITDSLTINPSPGSSGGPLTLAGQVQTTAVGEEVALNGNLAYVVGTGGIDVVNVNNPDDPSVVRTFGQSDVISGASAYAQVAGNQLIVASQVNRNANGVKLLIYSLSPDPTNPTLVSSTTLKVAFATGLFVQGNTVFLSTYGDWYSGSTLTNQFGDFSAIDISNPASPELEGVLFETGSAPFYGTNNENATVAVTPTIAYVAGTTSTGAVPNGQTTTPGEGSVLIVNTANPADLTQESPVGEILVPGTNRLLGIAIDGDRALVVGNSDGYDSSGLVQGSITLTVLDISDPLNPAILGSTLVTANTDPNKGQSDATSDGFGGMALALGGGLFAVSGTELNGNPVIELVNINDPANLVTATVTPPAAIHRMATANGELYATSADGLSVYNIGALGAIPVTASVDMPNGTGISVVPSSFSIAPTQIISGANFNTLVWDLTLSSPTTLTWQTSVTGLQPGESLGVTNGETIGFVSQGTQGTLKLPPASVTGAQIIGLDPAAQTVQPAAAATYTVTLFNPTSQEIAYDLSVEGVRSNWVTLPASVTVGPNASATETLTLTSDEFSANWQLWFRRHGIGGRRRIAVGARDVDACWHAGRFAATRCTRSCCRPDYSASHGRPGHRGQLCGAGHQHWERR